MAMQQKISSDDAVQSGVETPGYKLRIARERAGLTREAIAAQLNLLLSQVVALEDDRYQCFPAETFIKGHLRSYARLLKIDVDEILHAYYLLNPPTRPERKKIGVASQPQRLDVKQSHRRSYVGVAGICLVVLALWGWQQRREHVQLLSLNAGSVAALPGGMESALSGGADAALMDSVQMVPATKSADTTPALLAGNNLATQSTATPVTANHIAAATSSTTSTSASSTSVATDRLSLHFSADCWVEVKDRDDKVLIATLKHADDRLQIEGRGPFKVLLGYAPGVEMAYNGAPVKVDAPPPGNRSTRLIVGNS